MLHSVKIMGLIGILSAMCFAQTDSALAQKIVSDAATFVKANGNEAGLKEINNPKGQFVKGELYVFAYDTNAVMLAHPQNAKLVGKNLLEVPDVDGKLFRKDIVRLAKSGKTGWVDYKYKNPTNGKIEEKKTIVMGINGIVLCCGIYKK